jgi:BlaI family penicillinase repressor
MQALWQRGRATAREITDALNERESVAHSTVQTLLRKLEKKGALTHEVDDRTFVFRPLVDPENVRLKATSELIERLFAGSPSGLVSYLLRHKEIPTEQIEEIRRLIDEAEESSSKMTAFDGTKEE